LNRKKFLTVSELHKKWNKLQLPTTDVQHSSMTTFHYASSFTLSDCSFVSRCVVMFSRFGKNSFIQFSLIVHYPEMGKITNFSDFQKNKKPTQSLSNWWFERFWFSQSKSCPTLTLPILNPTATQVGSNPLLEPPFSCQGLPEGYFADHLTGCKVRH